jgi:quinol monooxygenase YgiN
MELFIFARFHAQAGKEAAVEQALKEVVTRSSEEAGCISIQAFRATQDARLFYIHSHWRDEAAFDLHATLPHTVHFVETVERLIDDPLEVRRTVCIA